MKLFVRSSSLTLAISLAFISGAAASVNPSGMVFENVHWSPDGRFLTFAYSFVIRFDARSEPYLAFYDVERDLAWTPHEGTSVYVPEFDSHYVGNRLGVFAVPSGGGPWRRLSAANVFLGESGRPFYYEQYTYLRYDEEEKIVATIALAPVPYHGPEAILLRIQLPEERIVETRHFKRPPNVDKDGYRRDVVLPFLDRYNIELPEPRRVYPPVPPTDVRPKSKGILLPEVAPMLNHMAGHAHEYYWLHPHRLVLMSTPRRFSRNAGLENAKHRTLEVLQIEPEGLVERFRGVPKESNLLRESSREVWKGNTRRRIGVRHRIEIEYPEEWPFMSSLIVTLDDEGKASVAVDRWVVGSRNPQPSTTRGNYSYTEGRPGPGASVFVFPLYQDETHPCGYFSDLAKATQVFFEDADEAEEFAREVTPLVRRWVLEEYEEHGLDVEKLTCAVKPVYLHQSKGLTFRENHQYIVLYDRLWHYEVDTRNLSLAYPGPISHYAVSPDGRYIAASVNMNYCEMQLLLFDIEGNTIKRILPPS